MTSREQIFAIARDLKWIAAISIAISALLYLPTQVGELYRISAADGGWILCKELFAIVFIGFAIWVGALFIAAESAKLINNLSRLPTVLLECLPVILGALPLLAASAAQLTSMPSSAQWTEAEAKILRQVGSVFRIQEQALDDDRIILWLYFFLFIVATIFFTLFAWRSRKWLAPRLVKINEAYFLRLPFFLTSIATIALFTAIFVIWPDKSAQFLGTFGVVAIFTLCITAFCVHASLLTIYRKFPVFPAIFIAALLFATIGNNDNHQIRVISRKANQATALSADSREKAGQAFLKWLAQPDRLARTNEYPVFVVSAQGGGIYAAQNAAVFLARMQDLCPRFRRHLFAVSGVSGGSVGAAIFAEALDSIDRISRSATPSGQTQASCDKIPEFLAANHGVPDLESAGIVEQHVERTLAYDFLSPLVAASLFPDFTQAFVPFPIELFDRARALEYTLENAADADGNSSPKTKNLLRRDYQDHWSPENGIPALIMNTTDAGSGKRVIISPFDIEDASGKDSPLCMLANVIKTPGGGIKSESLHFPLSTAAFVSARFPWVTPAATISVENDCITQESKIRLVDGGYIDNSGVETALNLIERIKVAYENARKTDSNSLPNIRIYFIALAGGDFADHGSFSFGELLEPIRALLSGRSSRAYIALNRASVAMRNIDIPTPTANGEPRFDTFSRTDLRNYFYALPLGWAMSDKTREIVSFSSGRFWDCEPDDHFSQTRTFLSNADCIQMQIYHLLNGSVKSAIDDQRAQSKISGQLHQEIDSAYSPERINHELLLACYETTFYKNLGHASWVSKLAAWQKSKDPEKPNTFPPYRDWHLAFYQSEHVRELLNEWDRKGEPEWRVLAYMLGSLSLDSADFARFTENLSTSSESKIRQLWPVTIKAINEDNEKQNPKVPDVNLKDYVNNPTGLANLLYGWRKNAFQNSQRNDGWNYRPRGIYQIIGREQYGRETRALSIIYPNLKINILQEPDFVWNRKISAKETFAHFYVQQYENKTLVQLLKDPSVSMERVRAVQKDMDTSPSSIGAVSRRSHMFLSCINETLHPKRSIYGLERFSHVLRVIENRFGVDLAPPL